MFTAKVKWHWSSQIDDLAGASRVLKHMTVILFPLSIGWKHKNRPECLLLGYIHRIHMLQNFRHYQSSVSSTNTDIIRSFVSYSDT